MATVGSSRSKSDHLGLMNSLVNKILLVIMRCRTKLKKMKTKKIVTFQRWKKSLRSKRNSKAMIVLMRNQALAHGDLLRRKWNFP